MGSKKKTSSNNDKSPKSNHGSDQHKNGTKPHKQSPKATSSRVKHAEKTKQTEKLKPRTSSAGRWVLIIVISSMVAGGAVLYTCPSVHDFIGELMLKYFHPDILSAVNNFMDATKVGIPSKTGESADAGSKSQPPDERIVKDKTEPVKSKEQVEQSEKITKKSTEQTQSKHKEKTDHKPEAKTKTNDKPIEKETKPKHKEKTDQKPEVKTKPDDKPIEKKTEPKHKQKTDRKPEGKPKPDDKPIEEKTEPKHKEKTDQKSEAKTKPDDKPTERETQPKHQGKSDKKPDTKTKSDDKPVEGESQPKLKDKTDQKPETKTKPDDKPVTKQTQQKTKEKPQDPVSDTKTSKKKETKTKPDDKPVGEQTQPKHKEKQPDPVSGENLNQKEQKSETKRKPEEKPKPKTKPDDKSGSEQTPRTNKDKPQEPVTTKIPNKQPETQTKPDDKSGSEQTPRTNKDKPQEPVTTKIPNKQPETQTKPDDKLKQDNKKSKEQKREPVTKQDGRPQDQPAETKTEQKPKVEKTPKKESQSATDKSTDEQKLKKKTKDEEAKSEPAKLKDDAKDKESEESLKEKANSKASITNPADNLIRTSLNEADSLFEEKKYKESLEKFDIILKKYPKSPRALYGKALTLNELAEEYRSNEILEKCIAILTDFLQLDNVPDELYKAAGRKLYDRQQFRGWGGKASKTLLHLCDRFPEDTKLKKELGVSYLMIGRNDPAQAVFENILKMDPTDGFAMVHLGFILKTIREDYDKGIKLLADGIATNHPGTEDGRFYFHLGDALQRKNRTDEAYRYYHIGAAKKLFPSVYQRSMYNVDYLTPRPWWTIEETGYAEYIKLLEDNWEVIRDEGLAQLDPTTGAFLPEDEKLREKGSWKQFTLYSQGRKHESACAKAPKTCAVIDKIPDAKGCTRGQTKFSVMKPGVHVWPHCGPTNCRIRAHLGLVIPPGPKIRVINDTRGWKEGKVIVFDDSFEHEVWHDGNETRLVLIVDFWHPELTADLKKRLPPI